MNCFVTGASGFIGANLVHELLARGHRVKALLRPEADLRGLAGAEFQRVAGDISDRNKLKTVITGCDWCFHVAASYHLWLKDYGPMYAANVDGTQNVLQAAAAAGCSRIVYTSTVGCIGIPKDGEGDETRPVSLEDMAGAYKRSKFLAEKAALEFAAKGFPVVAVNPTAPIGDHDAKPTPTGKIILDFLKGAMPAYIDTGLNLVDVKDVAEGNLLACQHGRPGERYILGCENLTLAQILERLAKITGRPAPKVRLPYFVAYAAGVVTTGLARVTGKPPMAPLDAVRMAKKKMWVSSDKATRELGYQPGPVDAALSRAVEWFQENGYVEPQMNADKRR